jgi:hypothetical protein
MLPCSIWLLLACSWLGVGLLWARRARMLSLGAVASMFQWCASSSLRCDGGVLCAVQDIQWLQTITSLPIFVKGVMSAADSECSKSLAFHVHAQLGWCSKLVGDQMLIQSVPVLSVSNGTLI